MTETEKEALIDRLRRKYEFYARVSGDGTEHETMILLRNAADALEASRAPQPTDDDREALLDEIIVTDEMVDIIQESVYDDYREGDRPVIRAALEAVMALLSTERGEWEYGYRLVGDDGNVYKRGFAYDDPRDASERGRARVIEENEVHEANGMPRLAFELIRRRKAGPWESVTPKEEQ